MARFYALIFFALPFAAVAADEEKEENYGIGLMCPHSDSQVSFYTESNQQDAAGTLSYAGGAFTVTSDSIKDLDAAGAVTMNSLCDGGVPGLRIDSKRDGWLQAGKMWIAPNQEWDYGDWQDFLRKATIWKPLATPQIFAGGSAPQPSQPYVDTGAKVLEIYPLKFNDDNTYALVLLDESGAYAKTCAGTPTAPHGRLGWLSLSTGTDGKTFAVPYNINGCAPK